MPRNTKETAEKDFVNEVVFTFDDSIIRKINESDNVPEAAEYYDLPYRYNKTIVTILAQTPNRMFVYWDVSDDDRKKYESEYGLDFFSKSFPVLIVHNKTKNYSFEITINDFASSWYFDVDDAKCEYSIELGRRAKDNSISIPNNYLYITSSNTAKSPNDHILFEKEQKIVYFRNVKTNSEYSKDIAKMNLLRYMGKIFAVHDLYKYETIPFRSTSGEGLKRSPDEQ
ncbi:MAG: DUF4912 domain-containing protein [Firmicutes bacterium]|nr:DUF4912 domain-containing protein [Bacillota bacterium]